MKRSAVTHEFVEHLPHELEEGRIYVSILFATAAHKCCCGCGNEVVTPLSPTGGASLLMARPYRWIPQLETGASLANPTTGSHGIR